MKLSFFSGGRKQFLNTPEAARKIESIQREVELRYAANLANAGWLRRVFIREKMRREVEVRLAEELPSDHSLWLREA